MLKCSTLRKELNAACHKKTLDSAVFLTWSCNPCYLVSNGVDGYLSDDLSDEETNKVRRKTNDTVDKTVMPPNFQPLFEREKVADSDVVVFFQNHSYDTPRLSEPRKRIRRRRWCTVGKEKPPDNFKFMRVSTANQKFIQQHSKCCFLLFSDRSVDFIQYSYDLNVVKDDMQEKDHLIMRGFPQNLPSILEFLSSDDFLDLFAPMCDEFQSDTYVDEVKRTVRRVSEHFTNYYDRPNNRVSPYCYSLLSVPLIFPQPSFTEKVHEILVTALQSEVKYDANESEAVLVTMTDFLDVRLFTTMCDYVGTKFVLPIESAVPTITSAYPRTEEQAHKLQEKFIYKLIGFKKQTPNEIVWVFFCSHNMTQAAYNDRRNIEIGTMLFSPKQGSKPWTDTVQNRLLKYYKTSGDDDDDALVQTHLQCRRISKVDGEPMNIQKLSKSKKLDKNVNRDPSEPVEEGSAFELFTRAKDYLVNHLLVGVAGFAQLLKEPLMHQDNYTKFALYDYVFNDLAKGLPWKTMAEWSAVEISKIEERFFQSARGAEHAWVTHKYHKFTTKVLGTVFIVWGKFFELFNPEIVRLKPRISPLTIFHYEQIERVPRGRFLECPKQYIQAQDRENLTLNDNEYEVVPYKNLKWGDPYDALSFLLQHIDDQYDCWWTCPKNHQFYKDVNAMSMNPVCDVCKMLRQSYEVGVVYEEVRRYTPCVTVEMPILKAEGDRKKAEQEVRTGGNLHGVDVKTGFCMDRASRGKTKKPYLHNMAYDVFFVYQDKCCAIEVDDAGHRQLDELGNPVCQKDHDADAVKNVISYLMGVHFMRIYTHNYNSYAVISSLVKAFIEHVERSKNVFPSSFKDMHTRVVAKTRGLRGEIDSSQMGLANPRVVKRGNKYELERLKETNAVFFIASLKSSSEPVYGKRQPLYQEGQGQRRNAKPPKEDEEVVKTSLLRYLINGQYHGSYQIPKVEICRYLDVFGLSYNYFNFRFFLDSRNMYADETFYTFSRQESCKTGRLFDNLSVGGCHVVVHDKREMRSVNIRDLSEWRRMWYDVTLLGDKNETIVLQDKRRLVRLFKVLTLPPRNSRDSRASRASRASRDSASASGSRAKSSRLRNAETNVQDNFLKVGNRIWLAKSPNSSDGTAVEITSISKDMYGLLYISFADPQNFFEDEDFILPEEISTRVFAVKQNGQKDEKKPAKYKPVPVMAL
jgi:hypothetical protein